MYDGELSRDQTMPTSFYDEFLPKSKYHLKMFHESLESNSSPLILVAAVVNVQISTTLSV